MKRKIQQTIGIVGIPLLLIFGTVIIYLLAKGYRINIASGEIERTGVISVKTSPRKATIYLDEDMTGRSPKAIAGVSEGVHTIRLEKTGYQPWSTEVFVEAEQLIPLEIPLFLIQPTTFPIFPDITSDLNTSYSIVTSFSDPGNMIYAFCAIASTTIPSSTNTTSDSILPQEGLPVPSTTRTLQIWTYPSDRRFWELNVQPRLIAEFSEEDLGTDLSSAIPTIDVSISPNGQRILATITAGDTQHVYILNSEVLNSPPQEIPVLSGSVELQPAWSQDSVNILFSRNGELRTYDTNTATQSVISEKSEEAGFVWTTTTAGQIFFLEKTLDTSYIVRTNSDGSARTTVLDFAQKDTSRVLFEPSSPDTTDGTEISSTDLNEILTDITGIVVTPEDEQIILLTPTGIVLYTLDGIEAEVYEAHNPSFLSFSPEGSMFLYSDNENTLKYFCYLAEDTDPLHSVGVSELLTLSDNTNYHQFSWHPSGKTVLYSYSVDGEDTFHVSAVDIDNAQIFTIPETYTEPVFSIDNSGKYIISHCGEDICTVTFQE